MEILQIVRFSPYLPLRVLGLMRVKRLNFKGIGPSLLFSESRKQVNRQPVSSSNHSSAEFAEITGALEIQFHVRHLPMF